MNNIFNQIEKIIINGNISNISEVLSFFIINKGNKEKTSDFISAEIVEMKKYEGFENQIKELEELKELLK